MALGVILRITSFISHTQHALIVHTQVCQQITAANQSPEFSLHWRRQPLTSPLQQHPSDPLCGGD